MSKMLVLPSDLFGRVVRLLQFNEQACDAIAVL